MPLAVVESQQMHRAFSVRDKPWFEVQRQYMLSVSHTDRWPDIAGLSMYPWMPIPISQVRGLVEISSAA